MAVLGYHWVVSESNPFIMEKRQDGTGGIHRIIGPTTRPNWALIIPLAVLLLAVLITVCVILYRKWRRDNCYPIYFAGKVRYGRKGVSIKQALTVEYGDNWLTCTASAKGIAKASFFTDVNLTKPLDENQPLVEPLYVYPKLEK